MLDSGLVTALVNFGAAGVVVILIILGLLVPKPFYARLEEENRLLREALQLERQRSNDAAATAGVTNQLIHALTDMAADKHHGGISGDGSHKQHAAGLTWDDLQ